MPVSIRDEQGGSRINSLTTPPSILPEPPKQRLRAQSPARHPSCSTHTDWPPGHGAGQKRPGGILEEDTDVTGHLITPTAKTLLGAWPQLPPLCRAPGQMPRGWALQLGGQLPLCTSARPHPRSSALRPQQAPAFLPHSRPQALPPGLYHMQKPQNGLLPARQATRNGCLETGGPAMPSAAQAARSQAPACPLALLQPHGTGGLAAAKRKGCYLRFRRASDKQCHPSLAILPR